MERETEIERIARVFNEAPSTNPEDFAQREQRWANDFRRMENRLAKFLERAETAEDNLRQMTECRDDLKRLIASGDEPDGALIWKSDHDKIVASVTAERDRQYEFNARQIVRVTALEEALERFVIAAESWHRFHNHTDIQCDRICACIADARAALSRPTSVPDAQGSVTEQSQQKSRQEEQCCGHCGKVLDGTIQRCSNDGFCSLEGQPHQSAQPHHKEREEQGMNEQSQQKSRQEPATE